MRTLYDDLYDGLTQWDSLPFRLNPQAKLAVSCIFRGALLFCQMTKASKEWTEFTIKLFEDVSDVIGDTNLNRILREMEQLSGVS